MKKKITFGEFLVTKKLITQDDLEKALKVQNKNRVLGKIACELNYLTEEQLEEVERICTLDGSHFEEVVLSLGYLTPNKLKHLFDVRLRRKVRIGKLLTDEGVITKEQLYDALMEYEVDRKRLNKILVCETTKVVSGYIKSRLEKYNYVPLFAKSYEDALALAKKEKPDLIITNYALWGDHKGHDLCSEIIGMPETAGIHTIVIANDYDVDDVEGLFDYGVHYLLHMPFDEYELLNIIYSVEERKSLKNKETILIVDDSPIIRSMIASELKNKYQILMAADGSEGVAIAEEKVPDLILMDIEMPVMDGFTACRLLRENTKTVNIPTIIISSLKTSKDRAKGFEVGASEYFVKPFKKGQLLNFIEVLFEARNSKKTEKVLIVDDNQMILHIIQHMLGKNGFFPFTAHNGKEALTLLQREKFDIILSDIEMPEMDGYELCSIVKRDETMKHIPFIMISAIQDKESILKALAIGANDYLTKPFDEDELMARITSHVSSKRLYDELYESLQKNREAEKEILNQRNLLKGVANAMKSLLAEEDKFQTIDEILKILGENSSVDRCYIYEKHTDENTGEAWVSRKHEWNREMVSPQLENRHLQNIPCLGDSFVNWHKKLSNNKPVSGITKEFPDAEQKILKMQDIVSVLAMPIFVSKKLWGFIGFDDCRMERVWSKSEEAILMTAASGMGGALEKKKALDIVSLELDLDKKLREITVLLLNASDRKWFDEAIDSILGIIGTIFSMDCAYLFTISMEEVAVTHARYLDGKKGSVDFYKDLDMKKFVNSFPLYICDTFFVSDVDTLEDECAYLKERYKKAGVHSLLHIASMKKSDTINCIGLHSKITSRSYSHPYINFLLEIISLISQTEEKVNLFEEKETLLGELVEKNRKLEELSIKDGLTNLYNHRYFQDALTAEIKRVERYENALLSLILLDIDYFKKFNDNYGHQTGDDVLKIIASLIKESERETDVSARYGGEEFTVIMPGTNLNGAVVFAERLREKVEKYSFTINGKKVNINISLGVSQFSQDKTKPQLIKEADRALYKAKENGRNRVEAFQE